jgi:hypothetical protein
MDDTWIRKVGIGHIFKDQGRCCVLVLGPAGPSTNTRDMPHVTQKIVKLYRPCNFNGSLRATGGFNSEGEFNTTVFNIMSIMDQLCVFGFYHQCTGI